MTNLKQINLSIELLKFFALLIILNGHSDRMYPYCSFLATGGAIGDALFFFCSGFTIFLGRIDRFDNWYKRRITRIYPSVISWALIQATVFGEDRGILWNLLYTGGWFINCIMLYYVLLYVVRRYMAEKLWIPWVITIILTLIWYCFEDTSSMFMYGQTYFRWCFFFLFMLFGACIGKDYIKVINSVSVNVLLFILSLITYYSIIILSDRIIFISRLQILSLIPLMGLVYFGYGLCCSDIANNLMCNKTIGKIIRSIASLCLESYIVQDTFLTTRLNWLFPLNLILIWCSILIMSYFTRSFGRLIKQVFEKENFRWKEVFAMF